MSSNEQMIAIEKNANVYYEKTSATKMTVNEQPVCGEGNGDDATLHMQYAKSTNLHTHTWYCQTNSKRGFLPGTQVRH